MAELDGLLAVLASAGPLDVMPGPTDPAGHWLPQQPLPACVLPHASRFSTLRRCTNPYDASVRHTSKQSCTFAFSGRL
jgi:DNA polymerase delta subunit 2